ncbi:Uncharacterized protein PHPALM_6117 [Phytophthora palmivora]|uniref:Uncharacterized protein n=1 Tax=Phytophthora palmivora TaxID=4796 RepID=A0A2P4YFZ8_9STRA|nr:Uncharacterized protein PHPALM_6117 [Phytophthora palmivora]
MSSGLLAMRSDTGMTPDPATQQTFYSNFKIRPFVERMPAQRFSIDTKDFSVTKASDGSMHASNLLPALRSRWPGATDDTSIVIQQDFALVHIATDDATFAEASAVSTCNVREVLEVALIQNEYCRQLNEDF